ncbi:flagellar brake protein [Maridesulfovibrio ferrireducens]|uniref:flagellar brake protein n=1 Tax=Maridesulfovibrio ferrireducens TaxID=246191 RepID=UPI001A2A7521|nr:flagellar brake protein [Maridesulfovibrio ferrireducens]MBI9113350.1 flagellar brake protein [Maridesulfovibrio ferrireducens]
MMSQSAKLKAACTPGLRVAIELGGLNDKAPSIVLGGYPSKYVLLKEPMVHPNDKAIWSEYLYPGNEATVRYIFEGVASGFKTTIIKLINSPDKILFLKYPKRIETYNLRRHKRINCFLEAEVMIGKQKSLAIVEDLSSSGCGITYLKDESSIFPEIGDDVKIFCPYFIEDNNEFIPCKVQRATKDTRKIALGLTFDKPSPEILIKIQDYVATVLQHST